jgi:hypothetical protein
MRVNEGQAGIALAPSEPRAIGDHMRRLSKALLAMAALSMAIGSAQARSLQITGTAGYLAK